VSFDEAFQKELDHDAFVSKLESSLTTVREGSEQLKSATTEYSQIIDHVSDLAVLYNINARVLLGTDLAIQLLENVVHYHEGKPYLRKVPFERLFPPKPDEGTTN